jgi:hypothetical protein
MNAYESQEPDNERFLIADWLLKKIIEWFGPVCSSKSNLVAF